jgi:hypothetical protein
VLEINNVACPIVGAFPALRGTKQSSLSLNVFSFFLKEERHFKGDWIASQARNDVVVAVAAVAVAGILSEK